MMRLKVKKRPIGNAYCFERNQTEISSEAFDFEFEMEKPGGVEVSSRDQRKDTSIFRTTAKSEHCR